MFELELEGGFNGGEEGLRGLVEVGGRRGAEMGIDEADGGQLKVHDGVRIASHGEKSSEIGAVPSQGAPN